MSSAPSSAPPKMSSAKEIINTNVPMLSAIAEESSSRDTIHFGHDEDTVISAGSDTPKLRKKNRNSCVRTLSSHKQSNNDDDNFEERQKRLANTKKKIENDDESNSNPPVVENQEPKVQIATASKVPTQNLDDPSMIEWKRIFEARRDPNAFEQQLREANSKQEESLEPQRNQRRNRNRQRTRDTKPKATEKPEETINSSVEISDNVSPGLTLHAKMLEDALKSAKKETPVKQSIKTKKSKKTPTRRNTLVIKLPNTPKNKKTEKHSKENKSGEEKTATEIPQSTENVTNANTKPEVENSNQIISTNFVADAYRKPTLLVQIERTPLQLEVAENLLKLQEGSHCPSAMKRVSLNTEESVTVQKDQKREIQKSTSTTCISTASTSVLKTNENKIVATSSYHHHGHISISSLLETPLKLDSSSAFPKTPGTQLPPQLETPNILKYTSFGTMDLSLMKHSEFPTPSFPITPGCILTPFRDVNSPRSDQETGLGSSNRPTDYSSGSSYYKPDESDGVDKQLQSLLKATQRNRSNSQQSCDEVDNENYQFNPPYSQNIPYTQQQLVVNSSNDMSQSQISCDKHDDDSKLNTSTSSSSSSSSSGSSSSSDQSTLQQASQSELPMDQTDITHVPLKQSDTNDIETKIKDHLHSTPACTVSTLLLNEKVVDKQAEQAETQARLEEKLLRVKNSLKETELKNVEKATKSTKMTKRARIAAEARIEPLRGPPIIPSPSKRALRHPRKIISTRTAKQPTTTSGRSIILMDAKPQTRNVPKKRNVETEKVITEAAEDNATTIDTFRSVATVTQTDKQEQKTVVVEESLEVIQKHVCEPKCSPVASPEKFRGFTDSPNTEKTKLIRILEDSDNDNGKSKVPKKDETSVSNSKTTHDTVKSSKKQTKQPSTKKVERLKIKIGKTSGKEKPSTKNKKSNDKNVAKPSTSKTYPSAPGSPTSSTADDIMQTPYKNNRSDQIRELFGNISDNFETPVKSPTAKTSLPESSTPIEVKPNTEVQNPLVEHKSVAECVKAALDDDFSDSDEDSESEEETKLDICTVDESNKECYQSVVSATGTSHKKSLIDQLPPIGRQKTTIVYGDRKIILSISDEMDLYKEEGLYSKRAKDEFKKQKEFKASFRTEADTNVSTTTHSKNVDKIKANINEPVNLTSAPSTSAASVSNPIFKIKHKEPVVLTTTNNSTKT